MKKLEQYYKEKFETHGHHEASLGWSKGKQFIRFWALTNTFSLENKSILDIGCGFGDFVKYAKEKKTSYKNYHGIDLVNEFVEIAKEEHGQDQRNLFEVKDLKDLHEQVYDYAFASGVFGHKIFQDEEENYLYIEKTIEKALSITRESVSFDFISDKTDYKTSNDDFHVNPARILEIAYKFSRNVVLDNSVMPFEFVLILNKDQGFKKETTVFEKFLKERKA